ncbi:MAG: cell division protein FtsA [Spirochaetes bacterium]|nr:MAG: cell division protein FtsA [Spirochaetota bacterium]
MAKEENIIVGLDVGTTKICAIVGEQTSKGIDIIGIGVAPSTGMRKGVVVNIDSTVKSIRKAVEEAELMAGAEINSVFAGIAGSHIKGFNSHGIIAVKERVVRGPDIQRVIDAAKAVAIPNDRKIIHVLPQEFIVDDQDGIKDPLGMNGVRLEARVHIVTGAVTSAENIVRCANQAGLTVHDIILEPLAASESVLTPEEKELGVVLIDIGGGTTDIAIFINGSIKHTAVLPIAGNHITNDIAVGIRTPVEEAEKVKVKYGCALDSMIGKEEQIEVPSVGGRPPRSLSRKILVEIIGPRVEEILTMAEKEIIKSGYEKLCASGAVITGGSAMLPGLIEMAEQLFNMPTRRGVPLNVGGLKDIVNNPMYATGVGLVVYGTKAREKELFEVEGKNICSKVMSRMKEWIKEFFF